MEWFVKFFELNGFLRFLIEFFVIGLILYALMHFGYVSEKGLEKFNVKFGQYFYAGVGLILIGLFIYSLFLI